MAVEFLTKKALQLEKAEGLGGEQYFDILFV
jgi:hypothetical protein